MTSHRKKIFVIMLALVIAMAMLAGCGGSKDDYKELPTAWPKAELPSGFPEYTDGTVYHVGATDESVAINIKDTGKDAFDKYMAEVEKAGYIFDDVTDSGYYYAKKGDEGGYALIMAFFSDKDEAVIQLTL